MKAYFLAYESDQLIFQIDSNDPEEKRRVLGACRPGHDGNYYREVIVGFVGEGEFQYTMGFASWWDWCKGSIAIGDTLIDEEFSFDPDEVRIITADVDIGESLAGPGLANRK